MNYIFLGDSITCADRLWNPGTDRLGCGYVSAAAQILRQKYRDIQILNKGYDGLTLPFLLKNLERDCISAPPDLVCVLIGINDIGLQMNTGKTLEEQQFFQNYDRLLTRLTTETSARILCLSPFIFPHPQEFEHWIPLVRKAEEMIREAAAIRRAEFLMCHDFLNSAAGQLGFSEITTDGIHLTVKGHELLAEYIMPFL